MEIPISLKDCFGGEASGFTPWLQKHSQIIQDITDNKNIKIYKREVKVDSYYLDLMFRDNNKIIVVENQYGQSNHDHLGKCIVYSSLVNANKTIWIAETFSNEYYKILDSLTTDLILCSVSLETYQAETIKMRIEVYSKQTKKQLIYILDRNKDVIHKIVVR